MIEKLELETIDRHEPINDINGITISEIDNFPKVVINKLNEIIEVVNKAHTCNCHRDVQVN